MSQLLGPTGKPISSIQNKKAPPPKMGDAFGAWAGRDVQRMQLPGGGIIQFDLSKLTLEDYRSMTSHYQVNASLAVLSFMQHQSDWSIECKDPKIAAVCEENLNKIWTQLNRSLGTANWAGFSPNVLDWDNDIESRSIGISKVKDLRPEECRVNWKEVEGWAPPGRVKPKFKVYDGIKYDPNPGWPVPVENSFWYPLLMEEGDYYGRKLLKPAFTSWFFSILLHLFANRYYERFGEPTPVGRAPFEEEIDVDGKGVRGNVFMLDLLQQLRSRAAVVLPNDQSNIGSGDSTAYDYDIEYLEAQMRGADFERYMTRLDEEISIGLFTPILLLRTADVGSYNLGTAHMQVYLWMLNAMNDDRKQYIDKYILRKMVNYNFSENAPSARIVFRKMGNSDTEMIRTIITALISKGTVEPDLNELGTLAGLTLKEVEVLAAPVASEPAAPDPAASDSTANKRTITLAQSTATAKEILARVKPQVDKAFRDGTFNSETNINMGYKRKFEKALEADGVNKSAVRTNEFYGRLDAWLNDVKSLGSEEFSSSESFLSLFTKVLDNEIEELSK